MFGCFLIVCRLLCCVCDDNHEEEVAMIEEKLGPVEKHEVEQLLRENNDDFRR